MLDRECDDPGASEKPASRSFCGQPPTASPAALGGSPPTPPAPQGLLASADPTGQHSHHFQPLAPNIPLSTLTPLSWEKEKLGEKVETEAIYLSSQFPQPFHPGFVDSPLQTETIPPISDGKMKLGILVCMCVGGSQLEREGWGRTKGRGIGASTGKGGTGKGRREPLFSLLPFPQLRRQIYSLGLGRGVSTRKTDLQFCPLSVWVLSFNSPISINPHLATHPSSDISSFPSL